MQTIYSFEQIIINFHDIGSKEVIASKFETIWSAKCSTKALQSMLSDLIKEISKLTLSGLNDITILAPIVHAALKHLMDTEETVFYAVPALLFTDIFDNLGTNVLYIAVVFNINELTQMAGIVYSTIYVTEYISHIVHALMELAVTKSGGIQPDIPT
eukprot:TRINITY_DN43341_c0_g1_i1.p2 TRINITY_DN43341_c0_g1~~TRINITY_DN43341_c0_g1_i1.p2  ORF type:complete len:157 (-),score=1.52 TRINITY_DN43341_c0_g1_i1:928-1398(-)